MKARQNAVKRNREEGSSRTQTCTPQPRTPVLIDCDPGLDDALAMMLAFGTDRLDVLGVTTVAGNSAGEDTYRNARRLLSMLGKSSVPVGRGSDRPFLRPLVTAREVHGETGMGGLRLSPAGGGSETDEATAIDLMTGILRKASQTGLCLGKANDERELQDVSIVGRKVTLIATGPLTNVAILLLAKPELKAGLERIVLMGGASGAGNVTPSAEFNIYVDPEAASIVFESGVPLTMIGLDVTHKALVYPSEIERLRTCGTIGKLAAGFLDFYAASYWERGFEGLPVHDAVAVAHVILPDLVTTRPGRVQVETAGELTRGRTVVDFCKTVTPNCGVGVGIDRERFVRLLLDSVGTLAGV